MQAFKSVVVTAALPLAAMSLVSAPATAATTIYSSQTSFNEAIAPGSYTNTFSQLAGTAASYSYSSGGFGYTVTASSRLVAANGNRLGNSFNNLGLTVTFTAGSPTAIGGHFFVTNATGSLLAVPVTLNLSDGTSASFTPTGQSSSFRGFTSGSPITSLTMSAPGNARFNSLDNLVVGYALSAVPETSTSVLMVLGLLGLAQLRRHQAMGPK